MKKHFKTKAATLKTKNWTSARKIQIFSQSINRTPDQSINISPNKDEVNNEYFNTTTAIRIHENRSKVEHFLIKAAVLESANIFDSGFFMTPMKLEQSCLFSIRTVCHFMTKNPFLFSTRIQIRIPVLGIHDILMRIRIRISGSTPLTNGSVYGSNSGSDSFLQWL